MYALQSTYGGRIHRMPGIITHNFILHESIAHLRKKKFRSYLSKSVETLLHDPSRRKAALFGSIGPDIFDYNILRRNSPFGSRMSFILHNGGSAKLLVSMLDRIIAHSDHNTEWASTQRAFLYGYVSHIIADSLFHPYMFYWSGFPHTGLKKDRYHFREQNLLFCYNLDLFFLYYYRDTRFKFELDEMLPFLKGLSPHKLDPAVKDIILGPLSESFPRNAKRYVLKKGSSRDTLYSASIGYLDFSAWLVRMAFRLKFTRNPHLIKILDSVLRKKHVFSDLLVRFPEPRRINRHVLNHHRGQWFHPSGLPGNRYDSAEDILRECLNRVTDVWEEIEAMILGGKNNYESVTKKLSVNALTGDAREGYHSMRVKEPVRLGL